MTGFDPIFSDLPKNLPVFPLPNVLLLPKGRVTLNIFEPRYIAMIDDALCSEHRMIVMAQQCDAETDSTAVYPVGCAGRIVKFTEALDCRYQIELRGLYRCRLTEELFEPSCAYRRFRLDFMPYRQDGAVMRIDPDTRQQLMALVGRYFQMRKIAFDTSVFSKLHDEVLVTSLAMVCPFSAAEKQALLEAPDLFQRTDRLMTAMMMDVGTPAPMAVQ